MLSVVCPIYNEERYMANCIESILAQHYPKEDLEVLFVDGMSVDKTREIVAKYAAQYPFIRLIDNPHKIVPYAMNIGIKAAKGDVIMRLDAHAAYAGNYISALVSALENYHADNVGAVCRTDVLRKTPKSLAIREVLSNRFGVGNSTFRVGIKGAQEVETVPFGCWKKEVFDKYGMYDERLVRNQDIELNKRIIRGGGKIVIIPDTYSVYYARETYKSLAKNNFANGRWNILTVYYTKELRSLSIRHFVPLLFTLSLALPLVLGICWHPFFYVPIMALFVYMLVFSVVCVSLTLSKGLDFIYLLGSFITLHIAYGCGSLMGLIELLLQRYRADF